MKQLNLSLLHLLILLSLSLQIKLIRSYEIKSPRITNWGTWGQNVECAPGYFVKGVKVLSEGDQGAWSDDTALNGIGLQCFPINEHPQSTSLTMRQITSSTGGYGDWSLIEFCRRGIAIGFQLRSESGGGGDDTAANDIVLVCATASGIYKTTARGQTSWGYWTAEQRCPPMTAVCGLKTQVESYQGGWSDDTSLNNVDFICCDLPNPAENCKATDEWKQILQRDNYNGNSPIAYKLVEKLGVSYTYSTSESYSVIEEVSSNVGFGVGTEILKGIGLNFEMNIGSSTTTGYSWSKEESYAFSYEREETTELLIPAQCKTTLYQIVGRCGPYTVKVNTVKREDICRNGNNTIIDDSFFPTIIPDATTPMDNSTSDTSCICYEFLPYSTIMLLGTWISKIDF